MPLPRVRDGAVHPDAFRAASPRILWLLREVNDDSGEMTDLVGPLRAFAERGRIDKGWHSTYSPIAKVSFGLLHANTPWERWATDPDEFVPALREIAIVNIKKTAGGRVSKWEELVSAFRSNEQDLREQTEALDPHIVIGGNVLGLPDAWWKEGWDPKFPRAPGPYQARRRGRTIWVHAYHPAARLGHRAYFERVRAAIGCAL